ncbi:sulfotransferase 6B1 [Aplysia californica]|uniref:Sulfotransferase 6B1 n=1 Tax=Aplysia californica TaxID=6500 RepID=A0ABM0K7C1_APLCA|nr:sulfotransferase 6B1 [Aplysia californica]XP_035828781.1 sulfotransferase 6B1 [Aplysia californica]
MPMQKVVDSAGHSMKLYVHERKPYLFGMPQFNPYMLENLPDCQLRDDDVILVSYPKSGCHWLWEVTRLLVSGRTTTDKVNKENAMMEMSELEGNGSIDDIPSPRILNNHYFFENQPKDLLRKRVKTVLLYRNPKDVAVSFFHHHTRLQNYCYTGRDFPSYLHRFVDGLVDSNCIFDWLASWERAINEHKDLNICIMCYEDLQENPLAEFRRLAKFLGKDYEDDHLQQVIKATSIETMREQKGFLYSDNSGAIMFRKGKVGDWKNHFTIAQSEWFDHVTRTRMGHSKLYNFRYDL